MSATPNSAEEVRMYRKAKGLTQWELGDLAGLSQRTIRNIEAGKDVTESTLRDVYRALGLREAPASYPEDIEAFGQHVKDRLSRMEERERQRKMAKLAADLWLPDDVNEAADRIVSSARPKRPKPPGRVADTESAWRIP